MHDAHSLKSHCPSEEITVTQHPDNLFDIGYIGRMWRCFNTRSNPSLQPVAHCVMKCVLGEIAYSLESLYIHAPLYELETGRETKKENDEEI